MKQVLLIGAGSIAHRHAEALRAIEGIEIAGVCDANAGRAESLAKKTGAVAFTDAARSLDAVQPDYVVILTPRQVREPLIDLCLARRLPFFVEKPPCDRLSTGERLRTKIERAGILHSVGFVHRWHEALNQVLATVRSERLSLVTVRFLAPMASAPMIDSYPDPYLVERSGGLVGDQGIHYIDIARYICGAEIASIAAAGSNVLLPRSQAVTTIDTAGWTLTMDNGILVNHAHTWGAENWDCRIELVSDKSRVSIDMFHNRAQGVLSGLAFDYDGTTGEFELEHRGFLAALASGDQGAIRSSYADALKSFRATAEINEILYGKTPELD